jgi:hypothetical protein
LQGPPPQPWADSEEDVDLDVVVPLAAAGHGDDAAVHELVAAVLGGEPREEVVDRV